MLCSAIRIPQKTTTRDTINISFQIDRNVSHFFQYIVYAANVGVSCLRRQNLEDPSTSFLETLKDGSEP